MGQRSHLRDLQPTMKLFARSHDTQPRPRHLSCLTCRWADYRIGDEDSTFIECRRLPPTPVQIDDEIMVVWPQVTAEDYCGEWEKK